MTVRSLNRSHGYFTMRNLKTLLLDLAIGLIGGVAILALIIGASIQHQDRINEIASMEISE